MSFSGTSETSETNSETSETFSETSGTFSETSDYIKDLSCIACKQNIFNQLAHMEVGGCLYSE